MLPPLRGCFKKLEFEHKMNTVGGHRHMHSAHRHAPYWGCLLGNVIYIATLFNILQIASELQSGSGIEEGQSMCPPPPKKAKQKHPRTNTVVYLWLAQDCSLLATFFPDLSYGT